MSGAVKYINANAETVELDDGVHTIFLMGRSGHYAPDFDFSYTKVPTQNGAVLTQILLSNRSIDIPILIRDSSYMNLQARIKTLMARLNPLLGEGKLVFTSPEGDTVDILCRYTTGLQGLDGDAGHFVNFAVFLLTFVSEYAYFQKSTATTLIGNPSAGVDFFPIPGTNSEGNQSFIKLEAISVLGNAIYTNAGELITYPVWTVYGPCDGIELTNNTTNKTLELSCTLTTDEYIVIDTREGKKTITKYPEVENWFDKIVAGSSLWGMAPGQNSLYLYLSGGGSGSRITGYYYERYLSMTY